MARRRGKETSLLHALEIGLGMAVLVGLLAHYVGGLSEQQSFQGALFAGGIAFAIWLLRPLLQWAVLKARRFHSRNRRWWARRSSGLFFALGAGLLVALTLRYGLDWSATESVRAALVAGAGLFALWLVRPFFIAVFSAVSTASGWLLRLWRKGEERRAASAMVRRPRPISQNQLQRLSPRAFEELCVAVGRAWGYDAQRVGQSGDGGIDVEMWRDGEYVVAQCKRYQGTVPITHIRDFYGAMVHVGAHRGYFFTSGRFSDGAYEFTQGKPMELIDGEYLINIVSRLKGI